MTSITGLLQGFGGVVVFILFAWLISENRKKVKVVQIFTGLCIQVILAFLVLKVSVVREVFLVVGGAIDSLKVATCEGTKFVFGYLGGGEPPFVVKEGMSPFIFAFQPLPMVMVVSALSMLLFHWNILPILVRGFSVALKRGLNIGGALGVCCAAKVFLGQTEAPLLIRPYLNKISRSELFTVMTAGMATTSATIMVLYGTLLEGTIANPISHILTASIISIPAAIVVSRVMVPQLGENTAGDLVMPYQFSGSMDAVSQGASDGLKMFLNILAMLIVAMALVKLVNLVLGVLPFVGGEALSLQRLLGYIFAPVTWLMGISWENATAAGNLLGTKTALNEVVAFIGFSELPEGALDPKAKIIMTYALCGFANFSSIGIQIGTFSALAPERREEVIKLGFRALIAGTIASCLSGTVVGILSWIQ